jgi:hypothetical protein
MFMRRTVPAVAVVVAMLVGAAGAQGATRYVANNGSDSGVSGATCPQAHPCLTIGHATGVAQAGDTVSIGAGTFAEAVNDGGKALTFQGAGNVNNPTTIDASQTAQPGLTLSAATAIQDLVVVGGLTAPSAPHDDLPAIKVSPPAQLIAITLTRVSAFQDPPGNVDPQPADIDIRLSGTSGTGGAILAIADSDINGDDVAIADSAPDGSVNVTGSKVSTAAVTDTGATAIDTTVPATIIDSSVASEFFGVRTRGANLTLLRDSLFSSLTTLEVDAGPSAAVVNVRDSLIVADEPARGPTGVAVSDSASAAVHVGPSVSLIGTTVVALGNSTMGPAPVGLSVAGVPAGTSITTRNTILDAFDAAPLSVGRDVASDGSTVAWDLGFSAFETTTGAGVPAPGSATNVATAPGFVKLDTSGIDDYHLAAASPLLDAGDPSQALSGETDLDGNPRDVLGGCDGVARPDIGAYEHPTPICARPLPVSVAQTPTNIGPQFPSITFPPTITHISLSPTRFRATPTIARRPKPRATAATQKNSVLRYTLSEAADVKFTYEAVHHHSHHHPDTYTSVGTADYGRQKKGADFSIIFGQANDHALAPGPYRGAITATDKAKRKSTVHHVSFTIVAR